MTVDGNALANLQSRLAAAVASATKPQERTDALLQARRDSQGDVKAMLMVAEALATSGHLAEAVLLSADASNLDPEDSDPYILNLKFRSIQRLGIFNQLDILESAQRLQTERKLSPKQLHALSVVYEQCWRLDLASKALEEAIKRGNLPASDQRRLVVIYLIQKKPRAAKKALRILSFRNDLNGVELRAIAELAISLKEGKFAIELAERRLNQDLQDIYPFVFLCLIMSKAGRLKQASDNLKTRLSEVRPNQAVLVLQAADILSMAGDHKAAQELLGSACREMPDNADYKLALARVNFGR